MTEVDLFQANRPRLFAVAYRMLGSASDAEDVDDAIAAIHIVRNPDKLRFLDRQLSGTNHM